MKRRTLFIIFVAITLAIASVILVFFDNDNKNVKITETDPLLKDALLLESLSLDMSSSAFDKLVELSSRQDAIGYYASIALGDRLPPERAINYFKRALLLYSSNDVIKKLAKSYEQSGNKLEAAKTYASVLPDDDVLNSIKNLGLSADAVAQVLVDANQMKAASEYIIEELDSAPSETLIKLKKLYAKALTSLGNYEEALPIIEDIKSACPDDRDLLWYYARCLEGVGNTAKAKAVYNTIGDVGGYRLGLILEREGKLADAASAYLKSKDAESRWKGAQALDRLKKHDEALKIYLSLSNEQGIYMDDSAFRAFVLTKREGGGESPELLSLFSNHPSWMQRLKKQPVLPEMIETQYSEPEFLTRMEAYRKSGRINMADVELAIGESHATLPEMLGLGDWYLSKGNLYQAARWGIKALNQAPDKHGYELAYQRPYRDQVKKAAEEFDMDENLIYAVIRAESSFEKNAISRVGAMGLMQIMPSTGKDIAARLKVPFSEKDLLNPETNIRFGTYYLKSLLYMFSGDLDKALAAYNGGAGNVKKWSNSGIGSSKEDFPTAVTFTETREYITKIQDSYYIYKTFYSD